MGEAVRPALRCSSIAVMISASRPTPALLVNQRPFTCPRPMVRVFPEPAPASLGETNLLRAMPNLKVLETERSRQVLR